MTGAYPEPTPARSSCLSNVQFPSLQQKPILAASSSKLASSQLVGSCYNASQSIILDAERSNQLDIMASFMLDFERYSSYSEGDVLVPTTELKSEGFMWPNTGRSATV